VFWLLAGCLVAIILVSLRFDFWIGNDADAHVYTWDIPNVFMRALDAIYQRTRRKD
jgi:hypothetical protein